MKRFFCVFLATAWFASPAHAAFYHLWSQGYGDSLPQTVTAVGGLPDGDVVIGGIFQGEMDFGGGVFSSTEPGYFAPFLARLSSGGSHVWSHGFAGAGGISDIAVDASGDVIVAAWVDKTVDFGGGPLTSAGASDIVLARFGDDGSLLWNKRFGSPQLETPTAVALEPDGSIVITGYFQKRVDLGGGFLQSFGGYDVFVARYTADGTHLWSQRFGNSDFQEGHQIAVAPNGDVAVAGRLAGSIDLGSGTLTSAGADDVFLGVWDTHGIARWSRRFGGLGFERSGGLVCDSDGNLVLTGYLGDDVGNVASFDSEGTTRWTLALHDSAGWMFPGPIASDEQSNVFMVGSLSGTVVIDGHELTSPDQNVAILELDSDGHYRDGISLVGGHGSAEGFALGPRGEITFGGAFGGESNFGGQTLPFGGLLDAFVASFSPRDPNYTPIAAFSATLVGAVIELRWQLSLDEPLNSFELRRRDGPGMPWTTLTSDLVTTGVQGYDDADIATGRTYGYQLIVSTTAGDDYESPLADVTVPVSATVLLQNTPNPFAGQTKIPYTIESSAVVTIDIFDAAGRRVAQLREGQRSAGSHAAAWNGRDATGRRLASGVYFYRLTGSGEAAKRMVLVR